MIWSNDIFNELLRRTINIPSKGRDNKRSSPAGIATNNWPALLLPTTATLTLYLGYQYCRQKKQKRDETTETTTTYTHCIYCGAVVVVSNNDDTTFCSTCSKPIPHEHVIQDSQGRQGGQMSQEATTEGRTPPSASLTLTEASSSRQTPQENARRETSSRLLSSSNQSVSSSAPAKEAFRSSIPHVPAEATSTTSNSTSSDIPLVAASPSPHSHNIHDDNIPIIHAVAVVDYEDARQPPRRTSTVAHQAICQQHAPVMQELQSVIEALNDGNSSTSRRGNGSRAARILESYRSLRQMEDID